MKPPAEFRSERLLLRRPMSLDAPRIFAAYAQDAAVVRYLTWHPHRSTHDTVAYIEACLDQWDGDVARTYIIDLPDAEAVGAFHLLEQPANAVSVGYVLARPFWGRGYMTEALKVVVDWMHGEPDIWRLWSTCDVDNLASARVMEKAGLSFEGILRRWTIHPNVDPRQPRDCRCYALVK